MSGKNLNKTILAAVQNYYFNRSRSRQGIAKWDKKADLDAIAKVADEYGYGFSAAVGTFWFTYSTKTRNITVEMTEETYPKTRKPSI